MDRKEIIAAIGKAAAGYQSIKLEEAFFDAWLSFFKDVPIAIFVKALEMTIKEHESPFFPSVGQVYAKVKMIKEIQNLKRDPKYWICSVTPEEASSGEYDTKLIIRECWGYAKTVIPDVDGSRQFDSPEEMQKSVEITEARQRKHFNERFASHQTKIKAFVEAGDSPESATIKALEATPNVYLDTNMLKKAYTAIGKEYNDLPESIGKMAGQVLKLIGG